MSKTNQIQLNVQLASNKATIIITVMQRSVALSSAVMESPELDTFIALLSANRAMMADPIPMEQEPTGRTVALYDPVWRARIPRVAPKPGVLLTLRHPGLGWIGSLLPPTEARALGEALCSLSRSAVPSEGNP